VPRRSTGLVLALALGIVLGLGLFAGLGVVTVLAAPADLRSHLLPASKGSRAWPHPPGTDEHLSLAQAAQRTRDPATALVEMRQCNFTDGAVRTWRERDGSLVEIQLLLFASTADAGGFYQFEANFVATDSAYFGAVDGIPEGVVIAFSTADENGYVRIAGVAREGGVIVLMMVSQRGQLVRAQADRLLKAQYDRL
jgi:hypothetical protein